MRILVKLPSRRPVELLKAARLYASMCAHPSDVSMLVTLDKCDEGVTGELLDALKALPIQVRVDFMDRVSKIAAVNYGLPGEEPWDVLLVASDDMWPVVREWDVQVRSYMDLHFPDLDGCLWFHDGQQRRICTLPVMGRAWFDRFGYVYFGGYKSYKADDEQHAVADRVGKMSPMLPCIIKHEHWFFGGAVGFDPLYRLNRKHKEEDYALFGQRSQRDFSG